MNLTRRAFAWLAFCVLLLLPQAGWTTVLPAEDRSGEHLVDLGLSTAMAILSLDNARRVSDGQPLRWQSAAGMAGGALLFLRGTSKRHNKVLLSAVGATSFGVGLVGFSWSRGEEDERLFFECGVRGEEAGELRSTLQARLEF